jgi:serine/threonine protein phosphatase PrpC
LTSHDLFLKTSWQLEDKEQRSKLVFSDSHFEFAFISDKGGREENQDCWAVLKTLDGTRVLCVADGLGGHIGGRIASRTAVNAVCEFVQTKSFDFEKPESLYLAFEKANQEILKSQNENPESSNMRTTLVVLMIRDGLAFWSHVGDVRLYKFSKNLLTEKTKDQSVPQMLADLGEIQEDEIAHHSERNKLLGSLGDSKKEIKPKLLQTYKTLRPGDVFMLTTDGFWEWVSEAEIQQIIEQDSIINSLDSLENIVKERAKKDSYFDNYTASLMRVGQVVENKSYWYKTRFKPQRSKDE